MDANAAVPKQVDLSQLHGRVTEESDSLDWLKNRLQGLQGPSLEGTPNWLNDPKPFPIAREDRSRQDSGGAVRLEQFRTENDAVGSKEVGPSNTMAFSAPLSPSQSMPAAFLSKKGLATDAPLQKRFRLFGSWVEPSAESGGAGGQSLGVQEGREQRAWGLEEQLLQLDGGLDGRCGRPQAESCEKDELREKESVGAASKPLLGLFEESAGVSRDENAANATSSQRGADAQNRWGYDRGNERQTLQGGGAKGGLQEQTLERTSSSPWSDKRDLAKLKLPFGPNSLLLYGGLTDPMGGGMGLFRADAAYLNRKRKHDPQAGAQSEPLKADDGKGRDGGGWMDFGKETSGGQIGVFEEGLRPSHIQQGSGGRGEDLVQPTGTSRGLMETQGGLRFVPSAGGFAGLEGVIDSRRRDPPAQAEVRAERKRWGPPPEELAQEPLVDPRGPKSRADMMAEQAAHELLTLAFAQRVGQEAQSEPSLERPKAAPPLASRPESASPAQLESCEAASSVALISADTSSEDDQPLALRQGGGTTPTKPPKEPLQVNTLALKKEGGHSGTGAASLKVAGKEAAAEVDDRCNYHSGKAKKGWRCKNPKLKGFKICVFHRKQRLDRRQMSVAAAASAKPSLKAGAAPLPKAQPPNPSAPNPIPRPPKKRPHAFDECPPGVCQSKAEEAEKSPPKRKRRSVGKPRKEAEEAGGITQDIEIPNRNTKKRVQGAKKVGVLEGGADEKGEAGKRKEDPVGAAVPGKELQDEERCTYRSGAQGKWRCKRQRHANFKFCQFHRESQKKYWDKKNQARRMLDKTKP